MGVRRISAARRRASAGPAVSHWRTHARACWAVGLMMKDSAWSDAARLRSRLYHPGRAEWAVHAAGPDWDRGGRECLRLCVGRSSQLRGPVWTRRPASLRIRVATARARKGMERRKGSGCGRRKEAGYCLTILSCRRRPREHGGRRGRCRPSFTGDRIRAPATR